MCTWRVYAEKICITMTIYEEYNTLHKYNLIFYFELFLRERCDRFFRNTNDTTINFKCIPIMTYIRVYNT